MREVSTTPREGGRQRRMRDDRLGGPTILSPVRAAGPAGGTLDSEESFLLSLIDGDSDVRSIVSLAALRETEVLGTLELLMDKGWIQSPPRRVRSSSPR